MTTGMSEQVERLPKWAQKHIEDLQRERDTAIRELNEWVDDQAESPVYVDELVSLGENRTDDGRNSPSFKRRYIQTHRVTFLYQGIRLEVSLGDNHIAMQWGDENRGTGYVAAIPVSFQRIELHTKENMR